MSTTATLLTPSVAPSPDRPLVVVGAGPVGLAAAAHAQSRGVPTVVLEAGHAVGAAVAGWGHVRLFSPWSELVDPVAERLLLGRGWSAPSPTAYPTGRDWVESYLVPLGEALATTAEVDVRLGHRVVGVARSGRDRMVDAGRDEVGLTVHVDGPAGRLRIEAAALVDASGTWGGPAPLGGDGVPAAGELEHRSRIHYAIPDLTDPAVRARYAGRRVAVAGSGASAQNALLALTRLAEEAPGTSVAWLVRRSGTEGAFGGGANDQLEARGRLGEQARAAVATGPVEVVTSFRTEEVTSDPVTGTLTLRSRDGRTVTDVDQVVVVTGFRPDLSWLAEVRLDLDPVLSAPRALAPLIDPNVHSCGTVPPHGATELAQPDRGVYLLGMKSYGRAPSFLALTGFEQARSVVAAVAGDVDAATRVDLVLPETGVCGGSGQLDGLPSDTPGSGCCAPSDAALLTVGGGCS